MRTRRKGRRKLSPNSRNNSHHKRLKRSTAISRYQAQAQASRRFAQTDKPKLGQQSVKSANLQAEICLGAKSFFFFFVAQKGGDCRATPRDVRLRCAPRLEPLIVLGGHFSRRNLRGHGTGRRALHPSRSPPTSTKQAQRISTYRFYITKPQPRPASTHAAYKSTQINRHTPTLTFFNYRILKYNYPCALVRILHNCIAMTHNKHRKKINNKINAWNKQQQQKTKTERTRETSESKDAYFCI
jgi:hypothetical protein